MGGALTIFGVISICFILFCVYFFFKSLEFVIVSVNLYKKMVNRQEAILKVLIDIRDNTKSYNLTPNIDDPQMEESSQRYQVTVENEEEVSPAFCYHCGEDLPVDVSVCPKCGKKL